MGWYDAFKGDTARVNLQNAVTSDSGSALKNFGDAFAKIGKTAYDSEMDAEKSAVLELEKQNEQNKLDKYAETEAQAKIDDAFKKDFNYGNDAEWQKSILEFEKPDGEFGSDVSNSALEYGQTKMQANEKLAQGKFNSETVRTAVSGGYKDFDSFVKDNPELVNGADGKTMKEVSKYFSDKDTALASLSAKEKDLKQQAELLKLHKKLNKDGKGFVYDETTDAKIAAQIKTAMGMDAPSFKMDDATKVEYQNDVAGAAKISKQYNLEPSLAIHVYQNPDLYTFKDGKVYESPQTTEKKDTSKKPSWKDYQ